VNPIEIPENGGNPSTDPKPTTPPDPTDNQGNPGKDKPNVGGQDKDPALENAEKLVKAAEDAEKTAEAKLTEVKAKDVVSQADADELTRLNNEVTAKKEAAEEAVNALPEGDVKDSLKDRVDEVNPVETAKTDAEKAAEELV
ncbi:GA-like domain-containing protein, partial [Gallibacterium anatis]|uniref:GA-like domain-containing protein n=2 Tax=Gallibacterium anatis TaxID=750 RepID=UPI0030C9E8AE